MPRRRRTVLALAAVLAAGALLGSACGGEESTDAAGDPEATSPTVTAAPDTGGADTDDTAPEGPPPLRLEDVGLDVEDPIALVPDPVTGGLLVAERTGRVVAAVADGDGWRVEDQPVLDIVDLAGDTPGERGLLGIETDADGTELYVSYTSRDDGASVVDAYELSGGEGDRRADRDSRRQLLRVEQPFSNHNGGHVARAPDGTLYLGLGDGGAGGDPQGNAQDRSTLLGKLVRLDPDGADVVPDDNPFVGVDGVRPEIFATGLRNPWRFAFDPDTGDLWIADVGQNRFEEVNLVRAADGGGAGANFGWDLFEGTEPFPDADPAPGAASEGPFVEPFHVYGRDSGCSVTGGVVHRGDTIPGLDGHFLFSDYCAGEIRSLDPDDATGTATVLAGGAADVVGFGTDADGEVYVISLSEGIRRLVPEQG